MGAWVWLHRWAGVVGCLLFVVWFGSGLVMMYVPYPALTEPERLRALPELDLTRVALTPVAAVEAGAGSTTSTAQPSRQVWPKELRLNMLADRPAYQLTLWDGSRRVVWADTGEHAGAFDEAHARRIAAAYLLRSANAAPGLAGEPLGATSADLVSQQKSLAQALAVEPIERDQWTVPQGLNPLRPLYRVALAGDGASGRSAGGTESWAHRLGLAPGTELYVSAVSGEVVRDTTAWERGWNWLGSVPHWIYFTPLRADPPLWRTVVLWVSGFCILSAITGLVLGVWRLRPRRGLVKASPFKAWWAWHHWTGLLGGVLLTGWIVSGWVSMDPNRWFTARQWPVAAQQAMAGVPADRSALQRTAGQVWDQALAQAPSQPKELQWRWVQGQGMAVWLAASDAVAHTTGAVTSVREPLSEPQARLAVSALAAPAQVQQVSWQTGHDTYYYPHGTRVRPLPVWRVELNDADRTTVYLHPVTGAVVATVDQTARLRRWAFNALHSLDLAFLRQAPVLWQAVMWLGSLLGLAVSLTALVLAWRRVGGLWRRRPGTIASKRV